MRTTLPSGTPAELVVPASGAGRGLVIAPDIWGLRPLFDDLAARLAREQGWAVCAVEPFPGTDLGQDIDARFAAVPALRDDAVLGDLAAAADATGAATVSLIGFCMGGMYAFKAAGMGRFHRVASFYGMIRIPAAWRSDGQGEPLEWLARPGASPTLAVIGDLDPYTPPDDVAALAGAGVVVERYAEAEHGFVHDAARPSHRPADAADAWAKVLAFLAG